MRVATIYYLFTALTELGLGMTVTTYAPFLESIGLTLGQISLINGIFWLIVILAEVPTGMIADAHSRAWSLRAGMVFIGIGGCIYFCATGVLSAIAGEAVIGIGMAFLSGAKQAWIADALAREGREGELRRVYATDGIIHGSILIIGGFLGAMISLLNARLIWLPLIITSTLAWLLSKRYMSNQGEPDERVHHLEAFRLALAQLKRSSALIWVILVMVLFGVVVSFNHYWSLYFRPLVGQLGLSWVWTVMYLGFIAGGWMVRRSAVAMGKEWLLILVSLMMAGLGLLLLPLGGAMSYLLVTLVFHELGRGMFQPLVDSFVQHRVSSSFRATFGSLQSLIGRIGFMITPFVVWFLIDGTPANQDTISAIWIVNGSFLVIGTVFFYFFRPRQ